MEIVELKDGIKLHYIKKENFKTDCAFITLTTPLNRENSTKNALLAYMMMRGTNKYTDQYILNKVLENAYGSNISVSFDKVGDNVSLRFNLETIANEYALNGENILKEAMGILFEIVFNPLMINGALSKDFIDIEKKHLLKIIRAEKDNKDSYAYKRCMKETFGENGFGVNLYGYEEDVEGLTVEALTEHYEHIIKNARIDIVFSGRRPLDEIKEIVLNDNNIKKLVERKDTLEFSTNSIQNVEKSIEIADCMDVVQGKLVLSLISNFDKDNQKIVGQVYNMILGGSANSLLFQNVREKNGMSYSISSIFVKLKNTVFIRCGIEIDNYIEAMRLIYNQLDYIKDGKIGDKEIDDAKVALCAALDGIKEEQVSEMFYYLGQDFSGEKMSVDEYKEKINSVSKENIIEFANSLKVKVIYLLRN
ncbi:MAG: insulinase family protein [Clostridia bacterium]|nr:insulinase family protein [Clostridia bacterium]